MIEINRIDKIRNEEMRTWAGVANLSDTQREAGRLCHVERKTEEDVVMRTWKWVDTKI